MFDWLFFRLRSSALESMSLVAYLLAEIEDDVEVSFIVWECRNARMKQQTTP